MRLPFSRRDFPQAPSGHSPTFAPIVRSRTHGSPSSRKVSSRPERTGAQPAGHRRLRFCLRIYSTLCEAPETDAIMRTKSHGPAPNMAKARAFLGGMLKVAAKFAAPHTLGLHAGGALHPATASEHGATVPTPERRLAGDSPMPGVPTKRSDSAAQAVRLSGPWLGDSARHVPRCPNVSSKRKAQPPMLWKTGLRNRPRSFRIIGAAHHEHGKRCRPSRQEAVRDRARSARLGPFRCADGRHDLAATADDVEAAAHASALARDVLVGHPMGGKVAQIVAARTARACDQGHIAGRGRRENALGSEMA
jgi:hypothetical protein